MIEHILYILLGLVLLVVGAEALIRGSSALALRLGIPALVIGLTIVAFGTGSPELALSVQAALDGNGGIALGNVIGSNIGNIALVLGAAALARPLPVRSELVRRETPVMVAITILLLVMLWDGWMSRAEGVLLVLGAIAYPIFSYKVAQRNSSDPVAHEFDDLLEKPHRSALIDTLFIIVGLAMLLAGANLMLKGAVFVATRIGMTEVVIGLTIIAIGTSLPELATSVVSARRGEADVAFGNVIGSNALNILAVLGAVALIHPFHVEGLRPLDIAALLGSAIALIPLMRTGFILTRLEGAALLVAYTLYLYSLWP